MNMIEKRLAEVRRAYEKQQELDTAELLHVAQARTLGVPWREVADALGITSAYCQRHYRPLVDELVVTVAGLSREDVVADMRRLPRERRDNYRALLQRIVSAKGAGATWEQIAEAVDMRRSNACTLFRPYVSGQKRVTDVRRPRLLRAHRRGD